jgi:hypothetical protein
LRDFFENWRFDHPFLFRATIGISLTSAALVIFMSIPSSPLMAVLGVTAGQQKLAALYYTSFWHLRAATNQSAEAKLIKSIYGTMVGIDRTGQLVISTPVGDRFVQSTVHIADVSVTNLYGAADMIAGMRGEDAKFEYYPGDQVVVWVRGAPFNVKLIEAGHAKPDPNPPTNIVDKAFAIYYWRIFNGSGND